MEAEYDGLANVILASWKEIMGSNYIAIDDVEMEEECDPIKHASKYTSCLWSFAWSIIRATYSEQFLAATSPEQVKTWVDSVCPIMQKKG